MSILKLAVIINSCSNDDEFLLVKQIPPPTFVEEEYSSYVDSDLWDLPSVVLNPFQGEDQQQSGIFIDGLEPYSEKLNFSKYDVESSLDEILPQAGIRREEISEHWFLRKYVEEAEFGPGPPIHTVFIHGKLVSEHENLQALSRWMSVKSCLDLLLEVKPSSDRVGPLLVIGLLADVAQFGKCNVPHSMPYQEYPPGFTIVPMRSKTAKPFSTTNMVVFVPENITDSCGESNFIAYGDSLIMDPGCCSEWHAELMEIVAALPKKLVVFVTHHHYDHVEGLSIIQKCNPDATLLAHENTMRRIGKDDWSLGYTRISGGELICIGGQQFNVISALELDIKLTVLHLLNRRQKTGSTNKGHTDGHVALLHASTHSLIVGDHCVGQGSAILDITSGGNMKEYFQTTYNFLEISPHALIPMHGRTNLWPKHMLCGYLKNRRNRESSVLKAIANGTDTLLDIVAEVYSDVDSSFWVPASSNVRIHVDHLAQQDKLPKGFSLEKFKGSCSEFAVKVASRASR